MKKIIIIVILIFFLFLTLDYHGCFRNNKDPLQVTKYFFECLKNKEWFLTYQIYEHKYFNDSRMRWIYRHYKMALIEKIDLNIVEINENNARIQVKLDYKDKQTVYGAVFLEKSDKIWLIRDFVLG